VGTLIEGEDMEIIKSIGDVVKDFFMGLTHMQAGLLTIGVVAGIVILAIA
jgi:hypothetical protein